MKILHINTWDKGGAAAAAKRLCSAQNKKGFKASFLSLSRKEESVEYAHDYESFLLKRNGKLATKLIFLANKIYNQIPTRFNKTIFFNRPRTLYRIHKHPLVQEADIIHFHSVVKFVDIPSFFTKIKKPVVWTLHDMNPFSGGKHYETGMQAEFDKLEKKFIEVKKVAFENSKIHVIALTPWLQNLSEKSELLSKFPHSLIPNCVDANQFKVIPNSSEKKQKEVKKILFVAENILDKRKGFNYLLKALPFLSKELEIMVIGNAQKSQFEGFSNITFLGYISNPIELAQIYASVDVYVISSLEDNLPNTIVESHLCGTPVVGFNRTGISGMIDHEKTGILVDELSAEALAKGIEAALKLSDENPAIRTTISKWAQSYYSEEKVVNALKDVYTSMLSG